MRLNRVYISSPFLLLISWLLYQDTSGVVWQGLLACALHEAGHCAVLRLLGGNIEKVTITVFGARIKFRNQMSYIKECCAAAAGPGVNIALAYLFAILPRGAVFAGVNLVLAVFNLLPVGTLDGARILYCLTALAANETVAYRLCRCVSFSFTLLFSSAGLCIALYGKNLTLFLMCLWLLKGPPGEISSNFRRKEWK